MCWIYDRPDRLRHLIDRARSQETYLTRAWCDAATLATVRALDRRLVAVRRRLGRLCDAAPATINNRQAALRRLVKLGRRFDVIEFAVELDDLPNDRHADRRGPGADGWKALWHAASARGNSTWARQTRALLRLLHDNALRKAEVVSLDLEHVDFDRPAVSILGKGKTGRQWVTLNAPTVLALRSWIEARGSDPGPLFIVKPSRPAMFRAIASHVAAWRDEGLSDSTIASKLRTMGTPGPAGECWSARLVTDLFVHVSPGYAPLLPMVSGLVNAGATNQAIADHLNASGHLMACGKRWSALRICDVLRTGHMRQRQPRRPVGLERVHDKWVNRLVHKLAKEAGLSFVVRPHGLRHAGITRALDLTNGDVRKAQRFARHADPKTTIQYDDDRRDVAGELARLIGEDEL